MKAKMILSVLTGVLILGGFTSEKNLVPDESVSLQDAEKQLLVKSGVVSNGTYKGDCIDLTLSNQKSKAVKVMVPAGTVFIADDEGEQNILVVSDIICFLKPGESKSFDISGFCCEKSDSSPGTGSTFKTSLHKDEKVNKLSAFLKDKNYPESAKQDAVWCVANGAPVSNIYIDDEKHHKELRNFVCELTGQKDTWYATPQNYTIDESRNINSETVEVNGMLSCDIDKPTHVSNEIYGDNGELIYKMGEPMLFPRKGHYNYEFKIKVQGWEKGKYYVLVKGGDKQLLKQEFEI